MQVLRQPIEIDRRDQDADIAGLGESVNRTDAQAVSGRSPKNQNVHVSLPADIEPASLVGSVVRAHVEDARPWFLRAEYRDLIER